MPSVLPGTPMHRLTPTLLPRNPTLLNYAELFQRRPFLRYCLNSFVIAAMSSLLCVVPASLAAYPLARLRGRIRNSIRSGLLAIAFFPPIVFLFPLLIPFVALTRLGDFFGLPPPVLAERTTDVVAFIELSL